MGLTARAAGAASKAETAREAAIEVFMLSLFLSCRCGRNVFETFCEGSIGEVDGGGEFGLGSWSRRPTAVHDVFGGATVFAGGCRDVRDGTKKWPLEFEVLHESRSSRRSQPRRIGNLTVRVLRTVQ
jgi:hypothetical protein